MRLTRLFFSMTIVLSMSFLIVACKCKNKDCQCNSCPGDSCRCDTTLSKKSDSISEPSVNQAFLFLDNSESMKGYSGDIKGYTNVLTQLSKAYGNTNVLLCCDDYRPMELENGKSLVDGLKTLKYGGSSLLHKDLKAMVHTIADNNIVFFVTDAILSGSSEDINGTRNKKGNPKWTLDNAAGLKMDVNAVFQEAREKNVATSVYQFRADYKGAYYCYDNSSITINIQRYFYVFVLGKAANVLGFKRKYVGSEFFNPVHQLHFIDLMPLTGGISVRDSRRSGNDWVFNIIDVNNKAADNNPGLIPVVMKAETLKNNLTQDEIEKLTMKMQIKAGKKSFTAEDITYDEKRGFSFLVNPNIQSKEFTVSINIPYQLPTWVKMSSCDDLENGDNYMKQKGMADSRTFLLYHLIDGMRQGLMGESELLFMDEIKLKQQEN